MSYGALDLDHTRPLFHRLDAVLENAGRAMTAVEALAALEAHGLRNDLDTEERIAQLMRERFARWFPLADTGTATADGGAAVAVQGAPAPPNSPPERPEVSGDQLKDPTDATA